MPKGPEGPKKYTLKEMAEIEKQRTLSDAELSGGGAKYKINEKTGQSELVPTKKQHSEIVAENPDLKTAKTLAKNMNSEDRVELFLKVAKISKPEAIEALDLALKNARAINGYNRTVLLIDVAKAGNSEAMYNAFAEVLANDYKDEEVRGENMGTNLRIKSLTEIAKAAKAQNNLRIYNSALKAAREILAKEAPRLNIDMMHIDDKEMQDRLK